MSKYYRVLKDTFLWKEGAILENNVNNGNGYTPIEDIWDAEGLTFQKKTTNSTGEYISAVVIENSPEWFERVYKSKFDKFINKTQAALGFSEGFTE